MYKNFLRRAFLTSKSKDFFPLSFLKTVQSTSKGWQCILLSLFFKYPMIKLHKTRASILGFEFAQSKTLHWFRTPANTKGQHKCRTEKYLGKVKLWDVLDSAGGCVTWSGRLPSTQFHQAGHLSGVAYRVSYSID